MIGARRNLGSTIGLAVALLTTTAGATESSAGRDPHGKPRDSQADLSDFSWAGFRAGESLPHPSATANVRDFGARGDGVTDDTPAFQCALDQAGVISVPEGRYRIEGQLTVSHSGTVLRGAGSDSTGTILEFTSSLADRQGLVDLPQMNKLSWSGGLIQVVAQPGKEHRLSTVFGDTSRGSQRLRVSDGSNIRAGEILLLRLTEDGQRSLERHLLGEAPTSATPLESTCAARVLDWTFQVAAVEGNDLVLSQPLRTDVKLSWAPTIWQMPFTHDVGIEHLVVSFPSTPYPGHHRERGFNAIDFNQDVVNSWISDVEFRNCDSGIFVGRRSKWITFAGLRFVSSRITDAKGHQGHHGIALSGCSDVLVEDMQFDAEFVHEMTITHRAMGNVFSGPVRGRIIDLDHHRDAPFENLFQNMLGSMQLQNGGSACYGPPSGARNTYWDVELPTLPEWLGKQAIVVGAAHNPSEPLDLRSAQRLRRIGTNERPSATTPKTQPRQEKPTHLSEPLRHRGRR